MSSVTLNDSTKAHDEDDDFIIRLKRARRRKMLLSLLIALVIVAGGTVTLVAMRPHPCERLARSLCNQYGSECPPNFVEAFLQKGTEEKCTAALGTLDVRDGPPGLQAMMGVQIMREILGAEAIDAQINAVRAKHGLPPMQSMPHMGEATK